MRESSKFALFLLFVSSVLQLVMLADKGGRVVTKGVGEAPLFELGGFRFVEYKNAQKGIEVLGAVGYHFRDKDVIRHVKLSKKESGSEASVFALLANKVGNKIEMSGSVLFERGDEYLLETELATYLLKEQILSIDSPFILKGKNFEARGSRSTVNLAKKTVFIDTVKAKFIY